jgi:hypothetical protein
MQKPGTPFFDVNQALGHQSLQLLVVTARHPKEKPREGTARRGGARFVHWPSNKCAEPSTDTPAALFRRPSGPLSRAVMRLGLRYQPPIAALTGRGSGP